MCSIVSTYHIVGDSNLHPRTHKKNLEYLAENEHLKQRSAEADFQQSIDSSPLELPAKYLTKSFLSKQSKNESPHRGKLDLA